MQHDDEQLESQRGHTSRAAADQSVERALEGSRDGETLATMDRRRAAKRLVAMFKEQDAPSRRRAAEAKANQLRRLGVTGVRVSKDQDQKIFRVWAPPGATASIPTLNKAARLVRRLKANMFVDEPVPEVVPENDDDESRSAAELATRVLLHLSTEGELDDALTAMEAFDVASDFGSGFRRYWVDPNGGGLQPVAIQASQQAQRVRLGPDRRPVVEDGVVDSESGQAFPEPYVRRYVRSDGTLSDEKHDPNVLRQWLPRVKVEILTANHIRFIPITARDIWQAEGVLVAGITTFGLIRRAFPDVERLEDEDRRALLGGIGAESKDLLPPGLRTGDLEAVKDPDQKPLRVISGYFRQSPRFPSGLYMVVAGEGIPLHRQRWLNPRTGEALDLPLDQFKQITLRDDSMGRALMSELGPGNEIRAAAWGAFLEHLDKFNNRRWFLPLNSTLQPKELQAPTATVLYTNPGGAPTAEDLPDFPVTAEKIMAAVSTEMDDEAGLQEVAQGVNSPSVQSGLHAQRIIEQVQAGLTDIRQNTARAITRGWRIQLQLVKAFYTVPQQLDWTGEDGGHKQREWSAADLDGARKVRLFRGSFTGLVPSAKAALAQSLAEMGLLDELQLRRIVIGNVGGLLGLQDDPHWQRIRRQIHAWRQGPSQRNQQASFVLGLRARVQAAFATPETAPPAVADPVLLEAQQIWVPVPSDEEPAVARFRHFELARVVSSTAFMRWPEPWRQPLVAEYQRMRAAAGVLTVAEQFQQAQQAQQQALEQARAAEAAKAETAVARERARGDTELARERMRGEVDLREAELEAQPDVRVNVSSRLGPEREAAPAP